MMEKSKNCLFNRFFQILAYGMMMGVILFLYPFNHVLAQSEVTDVQGNVALKLVCPEFVLEDSEFVCNLELENSGYNILGIDIEYELANEFSYIEFQKDELWDSYAVSSTGVVLTRDEPLSTSHKLGTLTMRATSNVEVGKKYNISLSSKVAFSDDLDTYQQLEKVGVSIQSVDFTDIINYIKINDTPLELKSGMINYVHVVDYAVTSSRIEVKLNETFANLIRLEEGENNGITNLAIGSNLYTMVLKSNQIEIAKVTINVSRKNADGVVEEENLEVLENPQTGSHSLVLVFVILFFSLGCIIFAKKKGRFGGIK